MPCRICNWEMVICMRTDQYIYIYIYLYIYICICIQTTIIISTTLTRNQPRHLSLYKSFLVCPQLAWHQNQKDEYDGWQPLVAVLAALQYTQRRGSIVGRNCQNSVLFSLQSSFEVVFSCLVLLRKRCPVNDVKDCL